ncbi:MAG: hypothetical protein II942_00930 [Alphaproteobacteria bacterium]|nr:hypothetical protein [Alphaproteobacteria bacterium]
MFTKRSLFFKKHTRRVFIVKHALPVFAFLFAAVIVVWPMLSPDKERFDLPLQKSSVKTPSVDMEKIRFFLQDDKQRTMSVTADSVKEIDSEKQIARLENPIGVYTLADGDVLTSKTAYGLAYQKDKYFFFDQPITTTTKSGYKAKNQNVKATYEGVMESDSDVSIDGPAGSIEAKGFHLTDKGNHITFKGHTHANIKQDKGTIVVDTDNGLIIDRTKKTLTGDQNVRIKQNENTLTADKVILYYTDNKKDRVKRVVAQGNVVLENSKNKITGDQGEYNPISEDMEMTGNVRLYQGKSFVTSGKATLNMKTGESRLENKQKGRIKGTISPQDLKK